MLTTPQLWTSLPSYGTPLFERTDAVATQIDSIFGESIIAAFTQDNRDFTSPGQPVNGSSVLAWRYTALGEAIGTAPVELSTQATDGFAYDADIASFEGGHTFNSGQSAFAVVYTHDYEDSFGVARTRIVYEQFERDGDFRAFTVLANTTSSSVSSLSEPKLAIGSDGQVLAVWVQNGDVVGANIDASVPRIEEQFNIFNGDPTNQIDGLAVTALETGKFAVSFGDVDTNPDNDDLYLSLVDITSSAVVNSTILSEQFDEEGMPSMATLPDGAIALAWIIDNTGGTDTGIRAIVLEADGTVRRDTFTPTTDAGNNQLLAEVVESGDGGFYVLHYQEDESVIKALRFDSQGVQQGAESNISFGSQIFSDLDAKLLSDGRLMISYSGGDGGILNPHYAFSQIWDPRENANAEATTSGLQVGTPDNDDFFFDRGAFTIDAFEGNDALRFNPGDADFFVIAKADGGIGTDRLIMEGDGTFDFTRQVADRYVNWETLAFNESGSGESLSKWRADQIGQFETFDFFSNPNTYETISIEMGLETTLDLRGVDVIDQTPFVDRVLIIGDGDAENITGSEGRDHIISNGGNDGIDGGEGNDLIEAGDGGDTVIGGLGDDEIYGGAGSDDLFGGSNNDTIFGGSGDDFIEGNSGNDTIVGGLGEDTMDGGADVDLLDLSQGDNGGLGWDFDMESGVLFNGVFNQSAVNFENVIGTSIGDNIKGNAEANHIMGGAGADTLNGRGGLDTVDGGEGDDLIIMQSSSSPSYAASGIETVIGGSGFDTIIMSGSGTMDLRGDAISGIEQLQFGSGLDNTLVLDATTVQFGMTSNATIKGFNSPLAGAQDRVQVDLTGDEDVDLRKWQFEDFDYETAVNAPITEKDHIQIFGGAGSNKIEGSITSDIISAAAGDDEIWGDIGNDFIDAGEGADTVYGGAGYDILISGMDADIDLLYGGEGRDQLVSFGGPDKLYGGADNDVYFLTGTDGARIFEDADEGYDIINASIRQVLMSDNIERLNFTSDIDHVARGNELDNRINGNAGDDKFIIDAGGADIISGGSGRDTFDARSSSEGIRVYLNNQDFNTAATAGDFFASIETFIGSSTADDVMRAGDGRARFSGSGGEDRLFGGNNIDFLQGGDGNDDLRGGNGRDTLIGGRGDDEMQGGKDRDQFRFVDSDFGQDAILDYQDGLDTLRFFSAVATDFSDFTITGNGTANVTVTLDANPASQIELTSANGSNMLIDVSDFQFY
ncbi:calcium-binding protein [Pseudahrensia aquimaris]|uniref:Calcium-binding protein n=1 Tax=Pseudahrensia aquimaris TaxID=744461 RepID=A0ABW3FCC0_9HYPH